MKWPNKQEKFSFMKDEELKEEDPTEELGCRLSPSERVLRVWQEIETVSASYGITDWEKNWLRDNSDSKWPTFTPRMEAVMQKIEAKVFGDRLSPLPDPDEQIDELTGELHFKGKGKKK